MALNQFKSEGTDDLKRIPHELGILPLRNMVAYPYMVLPLAVAAPGLTKLIEDAIGGSHLETILPPLRDRMETIALDGYTEHEKLHIDDNHLVPRQIKANGLRPEALSFSKPALISIIQNHTREAGVRHLERQIGAVCRKTAVGISTGQPDFATG